MKVVQIEPHLARRGSASAWILDSHLANPRLQADFGLHCPVPFARAGFPCQGWAVKQHEFSVVCVMCVYVDMKHNNNISFFCRWYTAAQPPARLRQRLAQQQVISWTSGH